MKDTTPGVDYDCPLEHAQKNARVSRFALLVAVLLAPWLAADVTARQKAAAGPPDPFAAAVQQGVADTAAEHQVAGPPAGCENTTTVFSLAARGGIEAVVIRERADEAWRKVEAPPDVRKRVDENLAAGHVVVLPGRAVEKRLGWWRVDPRTGTTVGVMDEGFRQTTERVELEGVPDNTAISGTRIRGVGVKDYPAFWSRQFARDILESRGWTADHPNYMEALEKVVDLQQYILEKGFGGIF
jgi:hypothetical protein